MHTDFLIVGGGVVGLTSAQILLQAGYRVTLVERNAIGQEASWAGGGILSPLCPWDYQEAVTRLALRGMDMFNEAASTLHAATGIRSASILNISAAECCCCPRIKSNLQRNGVRSINLRCNR